MRRLVPALAALLLGGCLEQAPALSGPTTVVRFQGGSYPLRVVPLDKIPVYSVGTDGRPAAPPLLLQQPSVRVAAPDKLTAAAVFEFHCRGKTQIDRARWVDEAVPFDDKTGEYVIAGPCA